MSVRSDIADILVAAAGIRKVALLDTHGPKAYCISQSQPALKWVRWYSTLANVEKRSYSGLAVQLVSVVSRDGAQRGHFLSDCGVAVKTALTARSERALEGVATSG